MSEEDKILGFTHDSWIQSVEYNTETKALTVQTERGDSYELQDVPREVYDEFAKAPSKGSYFNRNLKGQYSAELFS